MSQHQLPPHVVLHPDDASNRVFLAIARALLSVVRLVPSRLLSSSSCVPGQSRHDHQGSRRNLCQMRPCLSKVPRSVALVRPIIHVPLAPPLPAKPSRPILELISNAARLSRTIPFFYATCFQELTRTTIFCLRFILAREEHIFLLRLPTESQISDAGQWFGTSVGPPVLPALLLALASAFLITPKAAIWAFHLSM